MSKYKNSKRFSKGNNKMKYKNNKAIYLQKLKNSQQTQNEIKHLGKETSNKNLISSKFEFPIVLLERLNIHNIKQNLYTTEKIINSEQFDSSDNKTHTKSKSTEKNKLISANLSCENYIKVKDIFSANKIDFNYTHGENNYLMGKELTEKVQERFEQESCNISISNKQNIVEPIVNTSSYQKIENITDSSCINLTFENFNDYEVNNDPLFESNSINEMKVIESYNTINISQNLKQVVKDLNKEKIQDINNINQESNQSIECIHIAEDYESSNMNDTETGIEERIIKIENEDLSVNENLIVFLHDEEYNLEDDIPKKSLSFQTEIKLMEEIDPLSLSVENQFSIIGEEYPLYKINDVPLECSKCLGIYLGQMKLKQHFWNCTSLIYFNCYFCTAKFKDRRGIRRHLQRLHLDIVQPQHLQNIVNDIIGKAKAFRAQEDKLLSTLTIRLPIDVHLYCEQCQIKLDSIVNVYRNNCEKCGERLMMQCYRCDLCCPASLQVIAHVRGDCFKYTSESFNCAICDYVAQHKTILLEHTKLHQKFEHYENCRLCGRKFLLSHHKLRHELVCGKEAALKCDHCQFETHYASALKVHLRKHIYNESVIAMGLKEDCKSIEIESSLDSSATDQSLEKRIQKSVVGYCHRCHMFFKGSSEVCHVCKAKLTLYCKLCRVYHDTFIKMRLHVKSRHIPRQHRCLRCRKKFALRSDLEAHVQICYNEPDIHCQLCNFVAINTTRLRVHERRKHPKNPLGKFCCFKCNKIFTLKDTLRRHQRIYCDKKPGISCNHCAFKTKTKWSLGLHIQKRHVEIFS